MRARVLLAALAFAALPAAAQSPAPEVEAYSHILSAFTSRADPRVLSDAVVLGPSLRQELGGETSASKIYDALIDRSAGSRLQLRALRPGEGAAYSKVPGVNTSDPLFTLQAGDTTLLLQYAPAQKRVAFVEQLRGPAPNAAAAEPKPEAPKPVPAAAAPPPAPVVAVPAASVAVPAPAPAAPPRVAAPAPARVAAPPAIAAVPAVVKPAPPKPQSAAPRLAPTGPCVVKPVMSEQDLANCAAPTASTPMTAAIERPAPPPQPAAPPPTIQLAPPQCVIKPVMSEQDLRICAAVSAATPSRAATAERPAPTPAAAPAASVSKPLPDAPRPCVIKAVMSDEELRACGVRR